MGVTATVGWILASESSSGDAGGADGDGVVLEPAASVSAGAFFADLDLYPVEERALTEPVDASTFDAFGDLDESVALAGRVVRPFEPGVYSGTHDRTPCDVEALETALEDQPDSASAATWFASLDQTEDQRDDYVDDLTPVRLRYDTRVTSHRLEEGEAVAVQALLQAGTGVLVDESGSPRVRCAGGNPLDDAEPAPELDGEAAYSLEELAQNPDDAWDGLDPAQVVVVTGSAPQEHFDLADPVDGSLFRRRVGSDGSRDQTLESADRPDRCAEGCHSLEIAMEAVSGSPVGLEYDQEGEPVITTAGPRPSRLSDAEVSWDAGSAERGTYGVVLIHQYEQLRELTDDEVRALSEVPGFADSLLDNPELDNETVILETPTTTPQGVFVGFRLMQCVPGDITVTFSLDGDVVQTVAETVPCDESRAFDYTIE